MVRFAILLVDRLYSVVYIKTSSTKMISLVSLMHIRSADVLETNIFLKVRFTKGI